MATNEVYARKIGVNFYSDWLLEIVEEYRKSKGQKFSVDEVIQFGFQRLRDEDSDFEDFQREYKKLYPSCDDDFEEIEPFNAEVSAFHLDLVGDDFGNT